MTRFPFCGKRLRSWNNVEGSTGRLSVTRFSFIFWSNFHVCLHFSPAHLTESWLVRYGLKDTPPPRPLYQLCEIYQSPLKLIERFSYDLEKWFRQVFVFTFVSQWMKRSRHGLFREIPNMEEALFDWPIVLQYDFKAKYRLISRTSSGVKFFHPSVYLADHPFDKPIKSFYFRSFVVSVLFARFHFKVIRKSP